MKKDKSNELKKFVNAVNRIHTLCVSNLCGIVERRRVFPDSKISTDEITKIFKKIISGLGEALDEFDGK